MAGDPKGGKMTVKVKARKKLAALLFLGLFQCAPHRFEVM